MHSSTAAVETMIHLFERAGLGLAPFRVVGFEVIKHRAGDHVQAGSSCDFCGTGIANVFWIQGSEPGAVRFKVGCDCVQKTGDAGLVSSVKAAQKAVRDEKKAAAAAARTIARHEAERNANEAAGRGRFTAREIVDQEWEAKRARWEAERVAKEAAIAAERAASKHVGTIGQRVEWALNLTFRTSWEVSYGTTFLYSFADAQGCCVVVRTSSPLSAPEGGGLSVGDAVTLRGTVKEHGDYQGKAQTRIERCKVLARTAAQVAP